MLTPEIIKKFKIRLEKERDELEQRLSKFATKDPNVPGDWDAKFPQFETGQADQEESAAEVEEYEMLIDVEHVLELQAQAVNQALLKISTGEYGICAKCTKPIPLERLEANPSASACAHHQQ